MIVFENADAPIFRIGEAVVAGRRLAGRLLPYGAGGCGPRFRFDPIERRFVERRSDVVTVGPWRPEDWVPVLNRFPAGPVLVGPGSTAEGVRGAFRAAAEAALESGRAVYLLDPEPEGVPEGAGAAAVVLGSWRPGRAEASFPALPAARQAEVSSAALFPFLPGWTGEPDELEALATAAKAGGATALSAVPPVLDGEARRTIVDARASDDPAAGDAFFDLVHHGRWSDRMAERIASVRLVAERHGLRSVPPRPVGRSERGGNAAAAELLESLAEEREADEARAAQLYAAVRWIDDAGRDLAAVAREGNFRKVFPFGGEAADAAERALRESR